jgi:hypothetical protein
LVGAAGFSGWREKKTANRPTRAKAQFESIGTAAQDIDINAFHRIALGLGMEFQTPLHGTGLVPLTDGAAAK